MNPSYIRYNDEPVLHTVQRCARTFFNGFEIAWSSALFCLVSPFCVRWSQKRNRNGLKKREKLFFINVSLNSILHSLSGLDTPVLKKGHMRCNHRSVNFSCSCKITYFTEKSSRYSSLSLFEYKDDITIPGSWRTSGRLLRNLSPKGRSWWRIQNLQNF
jgi:hypothetical protein